MKLLLRIVDFHFNLLCTSVHLSSDPLIRWNDNPLFWNIVITSLNNWKRSREDINNLDSAYTVTSAIAFIPFQKYTLLMKKRVGRQKERKKKETEEKKRKTEQSELRISIIWWKAIINSMIVWLIVWKKGGVKLGLVMYKIS